jgi:hypothetical protein
MSALIGKFPADDTTTRGVVYISSSRGGVEIIVEASVRGVSLTPIEARAAAAAIVAASEEVERMRKSP